MEHKVTRMNLKPAHPGSFIQTEVIEDLGLEIPEIAEILEVPEAEVYDFVKGQSRFHRTWPCALKSLLTLRWTSCCLSMPGTMPSRCESGPPKSRWNAISRSSSEKE